MARYLGRFAFLLFLLLAALAALLFLTAGEIAPREAASIRLLLGPISLISLGLGLWLARLSGFLVPGVFLGLALACAVAYLVAIELGRPRAYESITPGWLALQIASGVGAFILMGVAIWQALRKPAAQKLAQSGKRLTPFSVVMSVLNFLNAIFPAIISIGLLQSPLSLENRWGIFVAPATASMIALGICLLVRPKQAWIAASVCVGLLVLEAAAIVPIGLSDTQGMGGGMLILFGGIGTGLFSIVPVVTLLVTLAGRRKRAGLEPA